METNSQNNHPGDLDFGLNKKHSFHTVSFLTTYAYNVIDRVLNICGPRIAGSVAEWNCSQLLMKELRTIRDLAPEWKIDITEFPFVVHPKAFIGWFHFFGWLCLISSLLYIWIPLLTFLIVSFGLVLFYHQFIQYKTFFDNLFQREHSVNLVADAYPKGVKNVENLPTIILSGHIDSAYAWPLISNCNPRYLRLRSALAVLSVLLVAIVSVLRMFHISSWVTSVPFVISFLITQAYLTSNLVRYIDLNPAHASPGAADDLAGVAIALSTFRAFLEGIRLPGNQFPIEGPYRVIFNALGSEEVGLRGAKTMIQDIKYLNHPLPRDFTLQINIDTVNDANDGNVHVAFGEGQLRTKFDRDAVETFTAEIERRGVRVSTEDLDIGATDASAWSQAGWKALNFTATDYAPAKTYHTKYDTLENVGADSLFLGIAGCISTASVFLKKNCVHDTAWERKMRHREKRIQFTDAQAA